MENLPPIHEMYSSLQEQRDYDVIRKYESARVGQPTKKSPTKKGSFLEDTIRLSSSPGPANKSNLQPIWATAAKRLVKYCDRRTYVDEIQQMEKKRNSPSPNHYKVEMGWPRKTNKVVHESDKINFLNHSEYESNKTPGPGNYLVATNIAKRVKEYKFMENKPLQPRKEVSADMNTYDPIPVAYATFSKYEKEKRKVVNSTRKDEGSRKSRENVSPGPGYYQMIHSWQGKEGRLPKGSISYLGKLSRGPSPNVYYH